MSFNKKEVLTILGLMMGGMIIIYGFYKYSYNEQTDKISLNLWILLFFVLAYLYTIYKLLLIYKLKTKTFSFTFYLINEQKKEVVNKEFIIYPIIKNKALIRGEDFFKPKSSKTGKVSINNLKGGTYRLAFRDKPRDIIGIFGVKRINQKKMIWYKTMNNKVKIKKKRRLWMIIDEERI